MGIDVKPLAWGETPFDHMDHATLLRTAQRMYAAVTDAHSVLRMTMDTTQSFWTLQGSGGRAFAECQAVVTALDAQYTKEDSYHAFYRYAWALLFPELPPQSYSTWLTCTSCGGMVANDHLSPGMPCQCHINPTCTGTLRLFTWDDLRPTEA